MYETETMLNQFMLGSLKQIIADIPADRVNERAPGNGHPPLWVLGHLAFCVELGEAMLGTPIRTTEWMPVFGPGSPDEIAEPEKYDHEQCIDLIFTGYPKLCAAAQQGDPKILSQPNGVDLLAGSPLVTCGDLLSHLLTTHLAFHSAQLSAWRRAAGLGPLF